MPLVVDEASPGAGCGRCPPSPGIGVRDRPEQVSGIVRNQCPETAGLLSHSSLRMIERVYSHLTNDDAYDAMMAMLRAPRDR